jgi:hypothetical protein
LVVDPSVENADILLDGRHAGIDVLRLTAGGESGFTQIAEYLDGRRELTTLHILSHGEPGALHLADRSVDASALMDETPALSRIAEALTSDAAVVLYGCSVAAGEAGASFIDALEAELGRSVAAARGPVGAVELGGSWSIRFSGGANPPTAFHDHARVAFPGLLANVTGTAGNDTLYGGVDDDIISGLAGNDMIFALDGADVLYGDAGNDSLFGLNGNDLLYGGDGGDTLSGGAGADNLYGGAGDDFLRSDADGDLIYGGDGNDTFSGSRGDHDSDTIADFGVGDTIVFLSDDLTSLDGTAASGTISFANGRGTLTLSGISSASGTFNATLKSGGNT